MNQKKILVTNEVGLHARPAAQFVEAASQFNSEIKIRYDGKEANAKSILNVLSLGISQGAEIELIAEGADEDQALAFLIDLIESNFPENDD